MKKAILIFALITTTLTGCFAQRIGSLPQAGAPDHNDQLPIWQPWNGGGLQHTFSWTLDSMERYLTRNLHLLRQGDIFTSYAELLLYPSPASILMQATDGLGQSYGVGGNYSHFFIEKLGTVNTRAGIDIDNGDFTITNYGYTWTLPHTDGAAGQALVTDGAGNLTFSQPANTPVIVASSEQLNGSGVANAVLINYSVVTDGFYEIVYSLQDLTAPDPTFNYAYTTPIGAINYTNTPTAPAEDTNRQIFYALGGTTIGASVTGCSPCGSYSLIVKLLKY